jgi:3-hydroxyacyl-CoA dehydrogenase
LTTAWCFERDIFMNLMWTPECRALRHLFMAERAAIKIPDVPADTPKRDIKSVAVIGAGTMGGGIAMNFLNAGIPVKMLEMKQEALDRGVATIARTTKPRSRRASSSKTSTSSAWPAEHHAELRRPERRRPGDRGRV